MSIKVKKVVIFTDGACSGNPGPGGWGAVIYKDETKKYCYGQVTVWEWKRKGSQQFHLEMQPTYRNKKEFVDTLGHEMVHLYQMANVGDTGNHNKLFYSFRPKLNRIGLDL